jgi:hypothetical protein
LIFLFFSHFVRWSTRGGHSPGGDRRIEAFRVDIPFCDFDTSSLSSSPVLVLSGEHAMDGAEKPGAVLGSERTLYKGRCN